MDLTPEGARTVTALRHLAAWGLLGGPSVPIDRAIDWDRLGRAAADHRIAGVVERAIDAGALVEEPSPRTRAALRSHHRRQLQQSLLAEADLVRVSRILDAYAIEHRVLKGLATAHLDHDDPAERITSDADLLVRTADFSAATEALTPVIDRHGTVPDRRPSHVERYGKDRTLRLRQGGWLDLHRTLAPAFWGLRLDHERLFAHGEQYVLAETTLTALTAEHRFIHALLHAGYTEELKIQSFRDIALIAPRLDRDPAQVLDDEWLRPVRGLLARGVHRFLEVLAVDQVWTSWLDGVRPDHRERWALRAFELPGSRAHWSGPLALPPHRWPGYLIPILAPSRPYLDFYGRSRSGHITVARQMLGRRRDDS